MAEEIQIYRDENIYISNLRAMLHGKTYAMANVTSVATFTQEANRTPAVILTFLGFVLTLTVFGNKEITGCGTFGLILLIIGIAVLVTMKNIYWVRIGSASGETNALSSRDRAYIERVVSAMNEAIVRRG